MANLWDPTSCWSKKCLITPNTIHSNDDNIYTFTLINGAIYMLKQLNRWLYQINSTDFIHLDSWFKDLNQVSLGRNCVQFGLKNNLVLYKIGRTIKSQITKWSFKKIHTSEKGDEQINIEMKICWNSVVLIVEKCYIFTACQLKSILLFERIFFFFRANMQNCYKEVTPWGVYW